MNHKLLQNTTVIFFSIVNAVLAFVLVDSIQRKFDIPLFAGATCFVRLEPCEDRLRKDH
ncbi:MAG TPA: hypothetical protein VGA53_01685 [Candidatus Paceibacterota bacterium]